MHSLASVSLAAVALGEAGTDAASYRTDNVRRTVMRELEPAVKKTNDDASSTPLVMNFFYEQCALGRLL